GRGEGEVCAEAGKFAPAERSAGAGVTPFESSRQMHQRPSACRRLNQVVDEGGGAGGVGAGRLMTAPVRPSVTVEEPSGLKTWMSVNPSPLRSVTRANNA